MKFYILMNGKLIKPVSDGYTYTWCCSGCDRKQEISVVTVERTTGKFTDLCKDCVLVRDI